jgi:agmatine deiminase
MPAEWEPHDAVWLAWPDHADLWQADLEPARAEFIELCRAIGRRWSPEVTPETLSILVLGEAAERDVRVRLEGLSCEVYRIPYGDIWLRDTAPIFLAGGSRPSAVRFQFNGWGEKYLLAHDPAVAEKVARAAGRELAEAALVAEGGAVEVDGEGTCLTSRSCLLNPNRNRGMSTEQVERILEASLGIRKTVWIAEGLRGDHTDGHIDTLARFAGPARVLCAEARSAGDPNRRVLKAIGDQLARTVDAAGRSLEVVTVPSPGIVTDPTGRPLPASYMNFYVANGVVVVPIYGSPYDAEAVDVIATCFPKRKVVGLQARHILAGGGAFHCITQQQPAARADTEASRE